jgi:TolB-like protein
MKYSPPELTSELARQQLDRLLEQAELKRSPVLAKFLEYVVDSKLEGREDEIKEYTIAIKGLGWPRDFNPQTDSSVRIHAGRLRRILMEYYIGKGKDDLVIIVIPKGTYVPLFNLKGKTPVSFSHQENSPNSFNGHGNQDSPHNHFPMKPIIAVLPFHDLSPESKHYFLKAFGEQLNTELSKFENISVISYYATEHFHPSMTEPKDIRNELEMDYVLTGSLRIFNDTLRLNIQLLSADSGNIVWTDSYERKEFTNENSYEIQDGIVRKVANMVADDHGIIGDLIKFKPLKVNEERLLHKAITQYFEYAYNYEPQNFKTALFAIEESYRGANDNVMVVSILAKLYLDQYAFGTCSEPALLVKGNELAARAIYLDPRNQHAKKAFAWGQILSGEKERSLQEMDRCIALNPAASSVLGNMGLGIILLGEYETGFSMLKRSEALHQRPPVYAKFGFALYHYHNNNFEESGRWLARMVPFDIAFSRLLKLSINGYMNCQVAADEQLPENLYEEALSIVRRIIFDPQLVNKIENGWKMAGFALKEAI